MQMNSGESYKWKTAVEQNPCIIVSAEKWTRSENVRNKYFIICWESNGDTEKF